MPKAPKSKISSTIGLDIGSYSIKCVEVRKSGDQLQLQRVSILPVGASTTASVSSILKLVLDPAAGKPEHVRISMSGSSLLIRRIQLPVMTPAELKSAIVFEAEGQIPFPIDDCILDFQILDRSADKQKMNVLLVAAKKDFVAERLKLLSEVNLVPEIIDVDIFCMINSFEMLGELGDQRTWGVLNIGHRVSSFAIVNDRLPFFVREIPHGGAGVTKALAEARSVDEETADKLKIDREGVTAEELKSATERGFERLVEELRHSIDYFENETGEELKNIWISGGGALSAGAHEILSEELGKNVQLWDNTKKMEVFQGIDHPYLSKHSPLLNVSLGMALRDLESRS